MKLYPKLWTLDFYCLVDAIVTKIKDEWTPIKQINLLSAFKGTLSLQ